jgi:hypothetical protein
MGIDLTFLQNRTNTIPPECFIFVEKKHGKESEERAWGGSCQQWKARADRK